MNWWKSNFTKRFFQKLKVKKCPIERDQRMGLAKATKQFFGIVAGYENSIQAIAGPTHDS